MKFASVGRFKVKVPVKAEHEDEELILRHCGQNQREKQ
jgi:hypothetical protein